MLDDALVIGGEPVMVGEDGAAQPVTEAFEAAGGERVALKADASDGSSWVGVRLLSPSGSQLAEHQDWGSAFLEPVVLADAGQYTVEITSGSGAAFVQLSAAVPTVTDSVQAQVAPAPWNHVLAPGENALLDVDLSAGQRIFITTATRFDGDGYGRPDFGGQNSVVQLLDSNGDVVAETSPWSEVVAIEYLAPADETYQINFDPISAAGGDVSLRVFDVSESTEADLVVDGSQGRVFGASPAQRLALNFDAVAGQRLKVQATPPVGGYVEIVAPDGSVLSQSVNGESLEPLVVAESGTYQIATTLGLDVGLLRASVRDIGQPIPVELVLGGSPGQTSILSDGDEVQFHVTSDVDERVEFVVHADGGSGYARVMSGQGYEVDAAELSEDGSAVILSDPAGGESIVTVTASAGEVSVRAQLSDSPHSALVPAGQGPVSLMTEYGYAGVETDLVGGSDYRIRLASDQADGVVSPVAWSPQGGRIQFDRPGETGDVWVFSAPSTGLYQIDVYAPWEHTRVLAEIYRNIGTPQLDIDHGSPDEPGAMNVHAEWGVDSALPIAGYAVLVDEIPDSDPGQAVTQTSAESELVLQPGTHWLHVRAVDDDGNVGLAAHRVVRVAQSMVGVPVDDVEITPGSPGLTTVENPTISAVVPSGLADANVRFTIRSEERWVASHDAPISGTQAGWTMPKRILRLETEYFVTAQLVDESGRIGPPGQPIGFALDPLAAVVDPDPCAGADCHAIVDELFRGSVEAGESSVLDVSNLADPESEDWVSEVHLNVERTSGLGEELTIYADDVEPPAQPTLTNFISPTSVLVSPSADGKFVLRNTGTETLGLAVTAVEWTSGYTTRLQALDEAIEAGSDRLAEEERPATAQGLDVVVAQLEEPSAPVCEESGPDEVSCLGGAADASGGEQLRAGGSEASLETASRSFAADIPGSGLDDECVENIEHWVYLSRTEACRITPKSYYRVDTRSGNVVGIIYFLLFDQLRFGTGDSKIKFTSRAYWQLSTGQLSGQPLTLSHNVMCFPPLCTNFHEVTSSPQSIMPTRRWSGYMSSEALVALSPGQVVQASSEDVYSRLSAIATGGMLGTETLGGPPGFRCDRRAEVGFNAFGILRSTGCVFDDVDPVFELNSYAYPKHAELVNVGQATLYQHPGLYPDWEEEATRPLTRIIAKGSGNRAVAQRMCKKRKLAPTCDEYPYNSTRQGCLTGAAQLPATVLNVCVVRSVPFSQNSGAGASLLWFLRANRVLYEDDYYITTTSGGGDPTET